MATLVLLNEKSISIKINHLTIALGCAFPVKTKNAEHTTKEVLPFDYSVSPGRTRTYPEVFGTNTDYSELPQLKYLST